MASIYQVVGKKGARWYLDYYVDGRRADFVKEYLSYAKGNKARNTHARDEITLKHFTDFMKSDRLNTVTAAKLEAKRPGGTLRPAPPGLLYEEAIS